MIQKYFLMKLMLVSRTLSQKSFLVTEVFMLSDYTGCCDESSFFQGEIGFFPVFPKLRYSFNIQSIA